MKNRLLTFGSLLDRICNPIRVNYGFSIHKGELMENNQLEK
jgi:hypothetical protein